MTVLLLMVPPALRSVSPKIAKKMIGAIILFMPKKYWTLVVLVRSMNLATGPYLSVRDAEEGNLKQEVEEKANHPSRGDAFAVGYVIGDVGKAWPDGCE